MSKKTRRVIILIGVVAIVLLAAFGRLNDVLTFLNGAQDSAETQTAEDLTLDTSGNTMVAPAAYSGPVLPPDDLSGNDLFSDGIAVVRLDFGIDGDTAAFIVNGKSYHVRMLAIDTPEVDENLRQLNPWGETASNYTKTALDSAKQIVLELDPDSDVFDKYGRLLAWVWVDGELHNYNIVEAGLAEVAYLYGDYLYTGELLNAQSEARADGLKIWGEKDPDYDY